MRLDERLYESRPWNARISKLQGLFLGLAIYSTPLIPLFYFLYRLEYKTYFQLGTLVSIITLIVIGNLLLDLMRNEPESRLVGAAVGFFGSLLMLGPLLSVGDPTSPPEGEFGPVFMVCMAFMFLSLFFVILGGASVYLISHFRSGRKKRRTSLKSETYEEYVKRMESDKYN